MATLAQVNEVLPTGLEAVRVVGRGGQRIVYEAARDGERICLKLMRTRDGGLERAKREIQVGYRLNPQDTFGTFDARFHERGRPPAGGRKLYVVSVLSLATSALRSTFGTPVTGKEPRGGNPPLQPFCGMARGLSSTPVRRSTLAD